METFGDDHVLVLSALTGPTDPAPVQASCPHCGKAAGDTLVEPWHGKALHPEPL
jgi:hypothetical protein